MPFNFALKSHTNCVTDAQLAAFTRRIDDAEDYLELTDSAVFDEAEQPRLVAILRGEAVTPAAGVVERMKVALFVLGNMSSEYTVSNVEDITGPGVVARCQHMLNDVLMRHPELLHPQCLANIVDIDGNQGLAPVAHIIAMGRDARFPMVGDPDVTHEALQHWAQHPYVIMGLSTPASDMDDLLPAVKERFALDATGACRASREWVIASLEQMWDHPSNERRNPYTGEMGLLSGSVWHHDGSTVFGAAMASALGIYGTGCPVLIECARKRAWMSRPAFREGCASSILAGLLVIGYDAYTQQATFSELGATPAEALRTIIQRFVDDGLCASHSDAARVFTGLMPMRRFMPMDTAQLVPVIRVLMENGGVECLAEVLAVDSNDANAALGLQEWILAARLCATETVMARVIDRVSANNDITHHLPASAAAARRSRAL